MKKYKLITALMSVLFLTACGNQPVDQTDNSVTVTTTTTTGTTISALTTTTTTTTDTTASTTAETVPTTEFTIPELPKITLTMATESTASTQSASGTTTAQTAPSSAVSTTAVTIGKAFTLEAETVTAAAGAKKVPFSLQIHNNAGFSTAVLTVTYGKLLPVGDSKTHEAEITEGVKTGGVVSCMFNNDTQLMAYALMSKTDCKEDGRLFTVYFDLPADAKSGDEYPISLKLSACTTAGGKKLAPEIVNGVIRVK